MPRHAAALPRSRDELVGLLAAGWKRESTEDQWDNFGPDAQQDQIDTAIKDLGMVDCGFAWSVAASGWKEVWRTPGWLEMMQGAASGDFNVLVVPYASRFARNLMQTVNAVEVLHTHGVAVLFAEEMLLSSNPGDWVSFNRLALDAEAFSRKLSHDVGKGYAAKRRRLGVPGGNRVPLGTHREGHPSVLSVEEAGLALVRRAYDLSAAGLTDRQVASQCGLKLTHVREVLTNDFYVGRLSDGSPSALGPLVEQATFDKVQALRARYSRRHRGGVLRRQYALSMLVRCGSCGRRLTGHGGRYRHVDACEAFKAAAPRVRRKFSRNYDQRLRGESYAAEWYDGMVGEALKKVAASALLKTETLPLAQEPEVTEADPAATSRIAFERQAAMARYLRDRDPLTLQRAMEQLDGEEQQAHAQPREIVTAAVAHHYLANLAELWADTPSEGRRAIAEAAFDHIDALGIDLVIYPSAEAERYGWSEAFGSESLVCSISRSGRGERSGDDDIDWPRVRGRRE